MIKSIQNLLKLHYSFKKGYTQNQRYDRFSVQQGLIRNEYYNVDTADYVNLSYDFIIWTTYIQQMNSIVEKIQYSEGVITKNGTQTR